MKIYIILILVFSSLPALSMKPLPSREWSKPFQATLKLDHPNSLESCNDKDGFPYNTERFGQFISKECRPEVVYSWGSIKKAEAIINGLKNSESWQVPISKFSPGHRTLFAALTPVSTFFYGNVPLRIKLRKDVQFIAYSNSVLVGNVCLKKNPNGLKNEVYIVKKNLAFGGAVFEIQICGYNVVDSISLNTQEHYDETLRDLLWITQKNGGYAYFQHGENSNAKRMIDINFKGKPFLYEFRKSEFLSSVIGPHKVARKQIFDGCEVTERALISNLEHFQKSVRNLPPIFLSNPDTNTSFENHINVERLLPFH